MPDLQRFLPLFFQCRKIADFSIKDPKGASGLSWSSLNQCASLRSCRSRRSSFHWYGKSTIDPAGNVSAAKCKQSFSTASCVASSPASPSVRPNGCWMKSAFDGLTRSVISFTRDKEIVGMPNISSTRWTSPTDWEHTGHEGTRTARSTPSSRSILATWGALFQSSLSVRGM